MVKCICVICTQVPTTEVFSSQVSQKATYIVMYAHVEWIVSQRWVVSYAEEL